MGIRMKLTQLKMTMVVGSWMKCLSINVMIPVAMPAMKISVAGPMWAYQPTSKHGRSHGRRVMVGGGLMGPPALRKRYTLTLQGNSTRTPQHWQTCACDTRLPIPSGQSPKA